MRWNVFRSKCIAISWLILISFLFLLPGSAFPRDTWLTAVHFDKWVHVGLFAILLFLWRSSFEFRMGFYNIWLFLLAIAYGWLVEWVQLNWVPYRGFDIYDIMADAAGAGIGIFLSREVYKKNKPL
jgi:VanZ family protein